MRRDALHSIPVHLEGTDYVVSPGDRAGWVRVYRQGRAGQLVSMDGDDPRAVAVVRRAETLQRRSRRWATLRALFVRFAPLGALLAVGAAMAWLR